MAAVTRGGTGGAADPRRAALVHAFHLVEDLQTPAVARARTELADGLAQAGEAGWTEVTTALLYAQAVDAVTHHPDQVDLACARLLEAAERTGDQAMVATALGFRAEDGLRRGDVVGFVRDVSRAVVLLDEDGEPLTRVSGLISVALAYEALHLWELGDELYTRAEPLLELCEDPLLEPVIWVNRALTWFWWTAALLEIGEQQAAALVPRTDAGVVPANLPESWDRDLRVSLLARSVLIGEVDPGELDELSDDGLEWLVAAQVHLALAHAYLRQDRLAAAQAQAAAAQALCRSRGTVYQRSFADWTAAQVEERREPGHGAAARAYASAMSRHRWDERLSGLANARDRVHAERLRAEHDHLLRRTLEDPLTGLGNRRAFDERLDYLRATLGVGVSTSMLVVDVDRFKRVNDAFGHEAGDQVLRRIGALVKSVLRSEDLAVRIGGDEFGAILTGTPPEAVRARADRIGQLVHAEDWSAVRPGLTVSVSVGAASGQGPQDLERLYLRADAALYAAKADGRGLLRIAR